MAGSSSSSSAGGASSTMNQQQQQQISTDETQIYDRQIRLWGLEAQNRFLSILTKIPHKEKS